MSIREIRLRGIWSNTQSLVTATRPVLLLKTLALMWLGAAYVRQDLPDLEKFLEGFIIVGPLLWGGLYILNDVADFEDDSLHPIKKDRPLPSRRSSPYLFIAVATTMIGGALFLSWRINLPFFLCVILMTVKQGLYTLPPFRFKERFLVDILSGSVLNSSLRFLTGWFLFSTSLDFPLLLLVSCEGLQVSGFMVNRIYSNYTVDLERTLGYNSTLIGISPKAFRTIVISLAAIGITSFLFLSLNSILRVNQQSLGCLPLESLTVLVALVIATPLFLFPSLSKARNFSRRDLRKFNDLPIYLILAASIYLSMIIKFHDE